MSVPQQDDLFHPPNMPSSRVKPRRLSNMTAQKEDLYAHPVIVAPPAHMEKPSIAHETALAMEVAKHRLAEDSGTSTPTASTGLTTPDTEEIPTTGRYAFAFDIDGVLLRGGEVIPEAVEAIKVLNGQNEYNLKVYVASQFRNET
jgi:Haloacid dehalogenase-like hydrolase